MMQGMLKSMNQMNLEPDKDNVPVDEPTEVDITEPDVDLDESDVVEPDHDPPQPMGNPSVRVTRRNREAAQLSKSMAMEAILEGKLDSAIDHLTAAIKQNPQSPLLLASRANVFLKLKKPNAAIRDSDAALRMDDKLFKGYKARGMAKVQLGLWEEATNDLRLATVLDFDEESARMLKKVELNVKKIEEHRIKCENLQKEREQRKAEENKKFKVPQDNYASVLRDGQVIRIEVAREMKSKLTAASNLSRLAIVYFTAAWCAPCRELRPIYKTLAAKYPKAVFMTVDIDEAREVAIEWRPLSIPIFYLLKNDDLADVQIEISMNSLEKKIIKHYA